jgi:hypothetical protein
MQMESLKALDLDEYVVKGTDEDWEAALASKVGKGWWLYRSTPCTLNN